LKRPVEILEGLELEVLQMRFAKGEITKEEYEERKAILERDKETPFQTTNHEQI
jgi:hypothetical protein